MEPEGQAAQQVVNRVAVERSTVGREEETLAEVGVEDMVLTLVDVEDGR